MSELDLCLTPGQLSHFQPVSLPHNTSVQCRRRHGCIDDGRSGGDVVVVMVVMMIMMMEAVTMMVRMLMTTILMMIDFYMGAFKLMIMIR